LGGAIVVVDIRNLSFLKADRKKDLAEILAGLDDKSRRYYTGRRLERELLVGEKIAAAIEWAMM
jgi:hypothetical protein